ncbi:tripartite tricarboxylate transporter substrate binding protein [Bordetella genomosp. 13]|uniref:ABC transporter substrate-binding protein n=1 Tax=Bordetella genomosp. 13 TaxID=463040 RepID=A0A1W6ZGP9_9BORD|nr:tripartite tricarboxylate transporter substrate binding protein [Bordetella genomosp. 13]ARP96509.1 ABC transporter substrate-binding protein [Bordetella genomosp. 13]
MINANARAWRLGGVAAVLTALACAYAAPQPHNAPRPYPDRPITIIVTFPPGGGTDLLARKLGQRLHRELGQPVVVENRPGASGNIGARAVARAAPDGYTLLMVNSSFAINPAVYGDLDFSPRHDFTAVANVAYVPSVLAVPAASPLGALADVLRQATVEAGPLPYASCGNGTPQHLAGEMLSDATGARLQHVPYRGCGPALTDMLSAQVPMGIVTASSALPHIRAGTLRALAVTSPDRSPLLPEVPTVAEQGVPGYRLDQWHGLLAPAGTPPAVTRRLHAAVAAIVAQPGMRDELLELGYSPAQETAAEFQALIEADLERFGALAQRMGLRVD